MESITPSNHPPTTHPGWCHPLRCYDTDVDRQHCSELTGLSLRDARLTFALVQADEFAFPDQDPMPELRIDVVHSLDGQDSTLYLNPGELQQLIDRLTTEYHRWMYLSTPVVHEARSAA